MPTTDTAQAELAASPVAADTAPPSSELPFQSAETEIETLIHASGEAAQDGEVSGVETAIPVTALPTADGTPVHITRDPRIRAIQWKDLVAVTKLGTLHEVTLSLPWIGASLFFFWMATKTGGSIYWAAPGFVSSFFLFLTGLRQVHNAYHYAVGISRRGCDILMFCLSIVMTGSMHAVQINHLHHHRHCLDEEDAEGFTAKLVWWKALLVGPYFPGLLHVRAFKIGKPNQLKWVKAEIVGNLVWLSLVFFVLDMPFLQLFAATMITGQCFTGFFAVWTVHHHCDDNHHIARTQRGWFKNMLSYHMFLHIEHHLFPSIPTRNLGRLAKRLDEVAPELRQKYVY